VLFLVLALVAYVLGARSFSDEKLERFFNAQEYDEEKGEFTEDSKKSLRFFEKARGQVKLGDVEKALNVSGLMDEYQESLKTHLAGIGNDEERFKDENATRAAILARLSGNIQDSFGYDERQGKDSERNKSSRSAIQNFFSNINAEDAEELGKKLNDSEKDGIKTDHSKDRANVAEFALASRLGDFLRGMDQQYRASTVKEAIDAHAQQNIPGNKAYTTALNRDLYIAEIARTNNIKMKKPEWEFDDPAKEMRKLVGFEGRELVRAEKKLAAQEKEVEANRNFANKPDLNYFEAKNALPKFESLQRNLEDLVDSLERQHEDLSALKDRMAPNSDDETAAKTHFERLTKQLEKVRGLRDTHAQEMRKVKDKGEPTS